MRKRFTSLLVLLVSFMLTIPVLAEQSVELIDYTYNFPQALNGWTTIDADGDGNTWNLLIDKNNSGYNGDPGMMQSASYLSSALTPDNYLVSFRPGVLTVRAADPITVKATDVQKVYGAAVPELQWTMTGGSVEGQPEITCEVSESSPVGTYSITIGAGTIDYPNLDLCLKNKSEFQVFLECRLVDNTLYATFWGVKDGSWDEIHTVNEISDTGSSSYTVRAWRVYVKDGKEVDREELDRSTYDMDSGLIFIEADNDYRADTDGGDGAAADTSSQTGQGAATQTEINNEPEYTPVETEAPVQETPVYEESQSEAYSGTPELPDETIGD